MSNLFTSMRNASRALEVITRSTGVVQNNVANARTPGYARQVPVDSYVAGSGAAQGVAEKPMRDSRDAYAERAVRGRLSEFAGAQQRAEQAGRLEAVLPIGESGGIAGSLNQFFRAFSALSVAPNDTSARQLAIDRAGVLAESFRQAATSLGNLENETDQGLTEGIAQFNALGERMRELNKVFRNDLRAQDDPSLSAQAYAILDEMSQWAPVQAVRQEDGSFQIYIGSQALVLIGDQLRPLSMQTSAEEYRILDDQGGNLNGAITSGKLAALLEQRNTHIPSVRLGLDRLAEAVATQVNGKLAAGLDANGQPPATDLFVYTPGQQAATLKINRMPPEQLAVATLEAPGGNGNALEIAALDRAVVLDGQTMAGYYGRLAADAGRRTAMAKDDVTLSDSLLQQARGWRESVSGVSLDEEALSLVQYQRAYQASAKLITTLSEMTETLLGIIR